MTREKLCEKSVAAVGRRGCLLVFPLANRAEPRSLWSELYPRSPMRWEWDQDGDNRVSELWFVREQLSRSRRVIYAKWYQNRATLMSFEVFVNLLAYLEAAKNALAVGGESREVLELLQQDSPLSTRQIKAATELEGRLLEATYNKAMKPLWQNLQIVAFGEFDDSSFPSLGIGATESLFEDLWRKGQKISAQSAEKALAKKLGSESPFLKFARKIRSQS